MKHSFNGSPFWIASVKGWSEDADCQLSKGFEKKFVASISALINSQVKDMIKTAIPPGMDCNNKNLLPAIRVFINEVREIHGCSANAACYYATGCHIAS